VLSVEDVVKFHDAILLAEHGLAGSHGSGPLEGALSRVAHRIDYVGMEDAYEIAALYAVSIARGHCFNDANKRTALVSALAYLGAQGIALERSPELEEIMVDVAQGLVKEDLLAGLLFALHLFRQR
jgi:death-on-curing protein